MQRFAFPELKLDHLVRMTDCTGIIQHAVYSLPARPSGYTTDDNARALIVALKLHECTRDERTLLLAERYLGFLNYAQTPEGKYRNFVDYARNFLEEEGSEDAFGRATWACGYLLASHPNWRLAANARRLLEASLPWVPELRAPRAQAYALMGLYHALEADPGDGRMHALVGRLADSLLARYRRTAGPGWYWFEDIMTYSNGILPQALFLGYAATGRKAYLAVAVECLGFLTDVLFEDGTLRLVGNRGWYPRGGAKAPFDEQPVDAAAMVLVYLTAYRVTGRKDYYHLAEAAFAWFLGRNVHGQALYDPETGGCYDGLTPEGVNLNQGAESLIVYLLAYLTMHELRAQVEKGVAGSGA